MGLIGQLDLNCHPGRKIAIHRFHVKRSGEISIKARWVVEPAAIQAVANSSSSKEQVEKSKKVEVVKPILRPARLELNKKSEVEDTTPEIKEQTQNGNKAEVLKAILRPARLGIKKRSHVEDTTTKIKETGKNPEKFNKLAAQPFVRLERLDDLRPLGNK